MPTKKQFQQQTTKQITVTVDEEVTGYVFSKRELEILHVIGGLNYSSAVALFADRAVAIDLDDKGITREDIAALFGSFYH